MSKFISYLRPFFVRIASLLGFEPKQAEQPKPITLVFATEAEKFAYLVKNNDFVLLTYRNQKGEMSQKVATKNLDFIPVEKHPNGKGKPLTNTLDVRYFDLISNGWRYAKSYGVLGSDVLTAKEAQEIVAEYSYELA